MMAVGCSDSDKVFDDITEGVTRGAVLRQIAVQSNSVAINSSNNVLQDGGNFAVDLEYQDDEDGALLSEMNVFVGYADNTDDGVDNSTAEVLLETVPASAFSDGPRGLPVLSYSVTAQEMQSALGLANDQLGLGGDDFTVRFEVVLTDGRTFSDGQNSGTITGSYFNSPFLNTVRIVCAPSMPTAGTWTVVTGDAYGDGWNGASLAVVIDGGETMSIANEYGGPNEQIFEFEVPSGSQTISIMFVSGVYD